MSTTIELQTITCVNTSEMGHDEVYIKYSEDGKRTKRFPSKGYTSMAAGGPPWHPNLVLSFKDSCVVSLYDSDTGKDDFLGSHTYMPSEPQPETVTVSNTNGADYQLSTAAD